MNSSKLAPKADRRGALMRPARAPLVPMALPMALPMVVLMIMLSLGGAGCDAEKSVAAPGWGNPTAMGVEMAKLPPLNLSELPGELNLTPAQSTELATALDQLKSERASRGGSRHPQSRRGFLARREARRGEAERLRQGPPEPPMIAFLEDCSKILSPDQFTTLADYLVQRRQTMRPQSGEMAGRFAKGMTEHAAGRLGLTDDQRARMESVLRQHADQGREIWQSLDAGTITAEQARDQAKTLRQDLEKEAQTILTERQWAKVQQFRTQRRGSAVEQRSGNLEQNLDRRAEFTSRILGLTADQTAQVRQILLGTMPARQGVLERAGSEALAPEDAAYEVWQIEKTAVSQIRALLTPEQAQRFDALVKLLPRGVQPGPGMGRGPDMGPGMGMGRGMRGMPMHRGRR
jgi:hypothetical protein